ncbi:pentatricopeptide repeat-containing protein At1g09900 [Selaginella moellendorffii]|nr:pentatricopeptide repeat-containing protein At1g09900 [Selaginella moellendorffii]|eukprot:XP_002963945.2 pentatricopeptide repeat-containing protein At1g09900 [Selaginella moellendorffii]
MLRAKSAFFRFAAFRSIGANGSRSLASVAQAQVANPPEELDEAVVGMILESLKERPQGEALDDVMQQWKGSVGHKAVNKVLEQVKDGSIALRFFNWASKQEVFSKHSFHSYRLLLQRLAGKEARGVLQEMHDGGYTLKKKEYASIVSGLLKENHSEEVIGIVQDMTSNKNFNHSVVNHLIRTCYDMKKPEVASKIFRMMVAQPGSQDAVSKAADDGAWTVWSLLKKESDYNMTIDLLCREGLLEQACNVLDKMLEGKYEATTFTYGRLVDGFLRLSKFSEALAVLDVMAERGCIPPAIVYNQLIDGLCKAGKVEEAFELSTTMVKNGCSPTLYTYNSLINGLCLQGKTDEARDFLQEMADSGYNPDVVTYTVLINSLRRDGNFRAAVDVFDEMVSKGGCVPDRASYMPLLIGLCKEGCVQLVQEFLEKHRARLDLGSFFHNLLISTLSKHGKLDDARKVFRELASPELVHFNSFMSALCQRKLISEAFQVYEQLQKKGLVPDTYTYTILIGGLCDVGRTDQALSLKDTMIQNNCKPDSVTYGILRAGLLKAGRRTDAEQLKAQMPAAAGAGSSS